MLIDCVKRRTMGYILQVNQTKPNVDYLRKICIVFERNKTELSVYTTNRGEDLSYYFLQVQYSVLTHQLR